MRIVRRMNLSQIFHLLVGQLALEEVDNRSGTKICEMIKRGRRTVLESQAGRKDQNPLKAQLPRSHISGIN